MSATIASDPPVTLAIPAKGSFSKSNLSIKSLVSCPITLFLGFKTNCLPQLLHKKFCLPLWIKPFLTTRSESQFGQKSISSDMGTSQRHLPYILTYSGLPNSPAFLSLNQSHQVETKVQDSKPKPFSAHQQWNHHSGWKNTLNNLRLIVQPLFLFWLIYPWLDIFPNPDLLLGFNYLISAMNQFKPFYASG